MTAQEVREFRSVSKKLIEAEERNKLLKSLLKSKVCLREEELFMQKIDSKFKALGNKEGILSKKHDEMALLTMKYKIKDNNLYGVKLRKRRDRLRGKIESTFPHHFSTSLKVCRKGIT